ncbi:MAG TPA: nucleotide exchange factor GrpE [Synergistales bacterium]|nr:nucleotide exchange factor GrpE [Synergistales bacterium]
MTEIHDHRISNSDNIDPDNEPEVSEDNEKELSDLQRHTKKELIDMYLISSQEQEKMTEEMVSLLNEKEELKEALARMRADHYNYRQRVERDRQKEKTMAAEKVVLRFLPLLDNLERALEACNEMDSDGTVEGVRLVQKQFVKVLGEMEVQPILTVGSPFSPQLHEGVMLQEVDNPDDDGMVVRELEKGYTMGNRVIRPAKVQVGKYPG